MKKPNGLVTFLFTDIEDSTKLSQQYAGSYPELLERHNKVLQSAFETNNGFVFKTFEDSFCCAFQSAEDAVNAAVTAQINMNSDSLNDNVIKIRMGIHSGKSEWNGSEYEGYITLAGTSRVKSTSYGEQIIISAQTYNLINGKSERLPDVISFRDLGERRLKDVIQPIRLFQVNCPGLRADFPPLKTLDARPSNLPAELTSFIGREKEISEIKELLKSSRLLTLLGPGGTGKTRLSIQAGFELIDEYENGVHIVEFASIIDPHLIVNEIADVLKLKADGSTDLISMIIDYLKSKQLLLILDNCEHLVDECAKVSHTLLNSCHRLKILASSREPFKILGESLFQVPVLSLPDKKGKYSAETLNQFEAVRLFIDRAVSVKPNFEVNNMNAPALAELCTQLDGIPLAIELAAARINIFSVEKILDNISNRFKMLIGGSRTALPRQKTLRALIDWSYDLLKEKEKMFFERLAVFSGGWSLEAATNVCDGNGIDEFEILDLISNLADKSIVITKEINGSTRFNMLETIRQYIIEKLDPKSGFHKKHFEYYFALSSKNEQEAEHKYKENWKNEMELEEDNLRSAVKWGYENSHDRTAEFVINVAEYYEIKGFYTAAYTILKKIIESDLKTDKSEMATIFVNFGFLVSQLDVNESAEQYVKKGIEYFESAGNINKTAQALSILGIISYLKGNPEEAIRITRESLKMIEGQKDYILEANTKCNLATFTNSDITSEEALNLLDDALIIYRKYGQTDMIAKLLISKGGLYFQEGDYKYAEECFNEGLILLKEVDDQFTLTTTLYNLGNLNFALNKYSEAEKYFEESMNKSTEYGFTGTLDRSHIKLGEIALIKNERHKAKEIFVSCLKSFNDNSERIKIVLSIYGLGNFYFLEKKIELSARFFFLAERINVEMKLKLSKWRKDENKKIISALFNELKETRYNFLKNETGVLNTENAAELALKLVMTEKEAISGK